MGTETTPGGRRRDVLELALNAQRQGRRVVHHSAAWRLAQVQGDRRRLHEHVVGIDRHAEDVLDR